MERSMLTWRRGAVLLRMSSLRRRIGHDWRVHSSFNGQSTVSDILYGERLSRPRTRNVGDIIREGSKGIKVVM